MQLHFLGDIMLARKVKNNLNTNILNGISDIHEKGDLFVGNLECSISDSNTDVSSDFQASTKMLRYMTGMTGVSLANNHILDNGLEIAYDTIKNLDEIGVQHTGVGRNKSAAFKPIHLEIERYKIAIFSLTSKDRLSKNANAYYNHIALIEDDFLLKEAINKAKESAEIVIVLPHLGIEYVDYPSINTILTYRYLLVIGADIVIGTHPHVIQGSEVYNHGLIFYSLGDFVFDSMYSKRKESIVVSFDFKGGSNKYTIAHVLKNNNYLPVLRQTSFECTKRWKRLSINLTKLYGIKFKTRFLLCKIQNQMYQYINTTKHKGLIAGVQLLITKVDLILKNR